MPALKLAVGLITYVLPTLVADNAAPAKEEVSVEKVVKTVTQAQETVEAADFNASEKFFSPLVKNIAKEEGISEPLGPCT